MALTIYAFHDYPTAFAVTKVDAPIEECPFFLDFSRPLKKYRWFGVRNNWLGFIVAVGVPIIHIGQERGEYEMGIHRGDPYFKNILALWKQHFPTKKSSPKEAADGIDIISAFGRHFPENY